MKSQTPTNIIPMEMEVKPVRDPKLASEISNLKLTPQSSTLDPLSSSKIALPTASPSPEVPESPSLPISCTIHEGDSLNILPKLEGRSCKICLTSVPAWSPGPEVPTSSSLPVSSSNWGGWKGSLGSEPKSRQYISHLVKLFKLVLRVIANDGCLIIIFPDNPECGEIGLPWRFAFELQQSEACLIAEIKIMNTGKVRGYTDTALVFTKFKNKVQPCVVVPENEESVHGQTRGLIPIKLADTLINTFTNPGDIVLDPLAGTGSVAAAAVKAQRSSVSIDIISGCTQNIKRRVKAVNLVFDNFIIP